MIAYQVFVRPSEQRVWCSGGLERWPHQQVSRGVAAQGGPRPLLHQLRGQLKLLLLLLDVLLMQENPKGICNNK